MLAQLARDDVHREDDAQVAQLQSGLGVCTRLGGSVTDLTPQFTENCQNVTF